MSNSQGHDHERAKPRSYVKLSRHDDHNLELKSGFEFNGLQHRIRFDFYFFSPYSLHLSDYSKTDLRGDFHSRVRLSVPNELHSNLSVLIETLTKLETLIQATAETGGRELRSEMTQGVFETTRHLGALCGEVLKIRSMFLKKQIFLAHSIINESIDPTEELVKLAEEVEATEKLIQDIRKVIRTPEALIHSEITHLDEYLHYQYVDYLSAIRTELEQFSVATLNRKAELFQPGWNYFFSVLNRLQSNESKNANRKKVDPEQRLIRISQLKKFFQSEMFLRVAQRDSLKKIAEPAALLATAFAAVAGISLEKAISSNFSDLTYSGLLAVSIGIVFYVFKDRLKDRMRAYLTGKISSLLPDIERELVAEGRVIGKIREWFHFKTKDALPEAVRVARENAYISELESHLVEDILHYRKLYEIKKSSPIKQSGVQEILRINLQRLMKHMDDPFKSINKLTMRGHFKAETHRRVYYMHACLVSHLEPSDGRSSERLQTKVFRIILSKQGILRVERLDKVKSRPRIKKRVRSVSQNFMQISSV